MSEVSPMVFDGAQLVKVRELADSWFAAQVWFGGTTVNVYSFDSDAIREIAVWSVMDDEGKPVSRDEIEQMMEQRFELVEHGEEF